MERYICKECGRYCYTAATSLAVHTTKDKCPYEDCQGRCIPAPWNEEDKMTDTERDQLKQSIAYIKEALSKGLLLPDDASQLRRMIAYYEDKLKEGNNAPFKLTFNGREYDIVDETDTHFIAVPVYRNEGYYYISKEAVSHDV